MNETTDAKIPLFCNINFAAVPGVYRIVNEHTGDSYVGSTKDLRQRTHIHRSKLRRGQHHVRQLQDYFRQHGADAFVVEVLELVPDDRLLDAEKDWIGRLRPNLNTNTNPDRPHPRGGKPATPIATLDERRERRRAIAEAVRGGTKYTQVAKSFGVSIATVFNACRENGVPVRPIGPRGPRKIVVA